MSYLQPLVSIILPTLNSMRFLQERMESIFNQSFQNWELIIVDSYSTDGTWEFFQGKARVDSRIHLFQVPAGLYQCWNFGIRKAIGKYVYIATADDTMKSTCLEKMTAALEKHKECQICDSRLLLINEKGNILDSSAPDYFLYDEHFDYPKDKSLIRHAPHDFLLHLGGKTVYTSATQILVRKEFYSKIGLYPEYFGPSADYLWGMRAGRYANVFYIPEVLSYWRIHSAQVTGHSKIYENFVLMTQMAEQAIREINDKSLQETAIKFLPLIALKTKLLPAKRFPSMQTFLSSAISALKKYPFLTLEFLLNINLLLLHQKRKFIFVRSYDAMIRRRMKPFRNMIEILGKS